MILKKIIHFDMDYFFAQVEQRDNPELTDVPVGIGGLEAGRGVLCTSNYKAREFGVKSAMPTIKALKLCPQLVLIRPNFNKYKETSDKIFEIIYRFTNKVQKLSIDEAYLDVSDCKLFNNDAIAIAKSIRSTIYTETGLTCSAGVSFNKLLAKIGSDLFKPNGLAVLRPKDIERNISHFPISYLRGVGKVMQKKMHKKSIFTFGDLQGYSKLSLINQFGHFGGTLYDFCRGVDHREVETSHERKSLSVENTYASDLMSDDHAIFKKKLICCYEEMVQRLEKYSDKSVKSIFVKIRYNDFSKVSIERNLKISFENFYHLFQMKFNDRQDPVRLLGVGVRFNSKRHKGQLEFDLSA